MGSWRAKDLLVVLPARNEERSLPAVLAGLERCGCAALVVDDGSTDNTVIAAASAGAQVLSNRRSEGIARCVLKAISFAKELGFQKIVTMDADGQHDPAYVPSFAFMLESVDVVFGSRFEALAAVPVEKRASNSFAANLVSNATGRRCRDAACGMRGFRLDAGIEAMIGGGGYAFPYEMLMGAFSHGLSIGWCPIPALYPKGEKLATRVEEIDALLSCVAERTPAWRDGLYSARVATGHGEPFSVVIGGFDAYRFIPLPDRNEYLIQCEERLMQFDFKVEEGGPSQTDLEVRHD